MQTTDVWIYRDQSQLGFDPTSGKDLTGYHVEALDGSIGKVDEATYDVGESYVIVDTGPWIFGKKVMLPAGVIQRVDENEEKVFVNRNKDQIKSAPEYDDSMNTDPSYRDISAPTTVPAASVTATGTDSFLTPRHQLGGTAGRVIGRVSDRLARPNPIGGRPWHRLSVRTSHAVWLMLSSTCCGLWCLPS